MHQTSDVAQSPSNGNVAWFLMGAAFVVLTWPVGLFFLLVGSIWRLLLGSRLDIAVATRNFLGPFLLGLGLFVVVFAWGRLQRRSPALEISWAMSEFRESFFRQIEFGFYAALGLILLLSVLTLLLKLDFLSPYARVRFVLSRGVFVILGATCFVLTTASALDQHARNEYRDLRAQVRNARHEDAKAKAQADVDEAWAAQLVGLSKAQRRILLDLATHTKDPRDLARHSVESAAAKVARRPGMESAPTPRAWRSDDGQTEEAWSALRSELQERRRSRGDEARHERHLRQAMQLAVSELVGVSAPETAGPLEAWLHEVIRVAVSRRLSGWSVPEFVTVLEHSWLRTVDERVTTRQDAQNPRVSPSTAELSRFGYVASLGPSGTSPVRSWELYGGRVPMPIPGRIPVVR